MKTGITLLFLIINNIFIFSQFAKIVDKDGYVNIRKGAATNTKIIGKINSGETVYILDKSENSKDWVIVDYVTKNKNIITGYIHESRIKYIDSYTKIPAKIISENDAIFILDDINIEIISEKFNYNLNKKYFSDTQYGNQRIQDKYKGKQIWGTDATIPQTHYKSIIIKKGKKTIKIPDNEIENLFNVNNNYLQLFFDKSSDTIYITALNSDGAGAYVVLIMIDKGIYTDKIVLMPF